MAKQEGRPTVMTEDRLQKLKEAFLIGCTDEEACLYAGIRTSTMYLYQQNHPEFLEDKEAWKKNPALKARKTLYNALDKPAYAERYLNGNTPSVVVNNNSLAAPKNEREAAALLKLLELTKHYVQPTGKATTGTNVSGEANSTGTDNKKEG